MQSGFETKSGEILPFKEWHDIGHGFSIMPMKTCHKIRRDTTGETVKAPGTHGPANDALMMALYTGDFPHGYVNYCFEYLGATQ